MSDSRYRSLQFQSALPRGERLDTDNVNSVLKNFNPRSHEGSDTGRGGAVRSLQISIRAPTRGATQIDRSIDVNLIFQSALPRGERLPFSSRHPKIYYFNPRSHEGSD